MRTLDSIKEVALPYHLIEENGLQVGFLLPQRNTVVEISPLADVIALPYVVLRCACEYCLLLGVHRCTAATAWVVQFLVAVGWREACKRVP